MGRYLYWQDDFAFLAERCFRTALAGEVHVLFAGASCPEILGRRHPEALITALDDFSGAREEDEVTLPLPVKSAVLRYQGGTTLPDLRPHFPLIRSLWQKGFRRYRISGLHGERVLELPYLLDAFVDCHKGRRCFVIGNGPSLNQVDMSLLKNEITLGANRGYLGAAEWGFTYPYWGVYDQLQIEEYALEYERDAPESAIKFFPFLYWPLLELPHACPIPFDWPRSGAREFSASPDRLIVGYSVLYMLLQVAAIMGCDPIYTLGLDHRYELGRGPGLARWFRLGGKAVARRFDHTAWYQAMEGAAQSWIMARGGSGPDSRRIWKGEDAVGVTHFHEGYTARQKRFLMPRPEDAARDYACAAAWAQRENRQILNATPGTALETLPRVDFESLFPGGNGP